MLVALTGLVLMLGFATAASATQPDYPCNPDDCTPDYENGYTEDVAGEDWFFNGNCRQVARARQFKTWWGHVSWQYVQRVQWCWSGNVVTSVYRDRVPDTRCCLWQFFGHIANGCSSEHCQEKHGHWSETVWTAGAYRHCMAWCTREVDPGVSMTVMGDGRYGWSTWGG
jgi:hypothetical protein